MSTMRKIFNFFKNLVSNFISLILPKKTALFLRAVDKFQRYGPIVKEINSKSGISLLEVGGGSEGLPLFINTKKAKLTILDISKKELSGAIKKGYNTVLADASKKIPFSSNSFDYVVSVGSLEHIKKEKRKKYCDELKRVARKKVFLHVPSGKTSELYDKKLYRFRKRLHIDDNWTKEHIEYGLPSLSDIKSYFPNSRIKFIQNADVWYKIMVLQTIPLFNLILPGIFYKLFWERKDKNSPFMSCIVFWNKE